jgi:glycosyltransferase involved in cell wall biosynthesis
MCKGLVFISAHNSEKYIGNAIQSLAKQRNQNFEILLVDDASVDNTLAIARRWLRELFPSRHSVVPNKLNMGKAANAFKNLSDVGAEYIAILDGDDQLIDEDILDLFSAEYKNNYDVVYSNYVTSDGRKGHCSMLDPLLSPREQGWRSSHFFSFRASLFRNIPITYFQDEKGDWFRSACDFAIAFPILDQTRRYKFIDTPAYLYTCDSPHNHHNKNGASKNLSSPEQRLNGEKVVGKPPLPCRRFLEGSGVPYEAFVTKRLAIIESELRIAEKLRHTSVRDLSLVSVAKLAFKDDIPLSWLRQTGGWAMDCHIYSYLAELLDSIEKPSILEFGSGMGSKILHKLALNRGGQCVSVEHDKKWYERSLLELEKHNLAVDGSVVFSNLEDVNIFGVETKFYDMSWLSAEKKFDVVLVDGPPQAISPIGRLASLPLVVKNLRERFYVFLDDFDRPMEQKIVQLWKRIAPELHYKKIDFEKSVCVISSELAD